MKIKVILLPIFIGLAVILSGCGTKLATNQSTNTPTANTSAAQVVTTNTGSSANAPAELVGTWRSECLVPDLKSNYAELHQFIIAANGAAQHKRWMYENHTCQGEGVENTDPYDFRFPGGSTVNQMYGGQEVKFDIYSLTGGTLLFGHGFRKNLPYTENSLNEYIRYSKSSGSTTISE